MPGVLPRPMATCHHCGDPLVATLAEAQAQLTDPSRGEA